MTIKLLLTLAIRSHFNEYPGPEQIHGPCSQKGKNYRDRTLAEALFDIDRELEELNLAVNIMAVKEDIEDEFADLVLTAISLCYHYGLDLESAINRKYLKHGGK